MLRVAGDWVASSIRIRLGSLAAVLTGAVVLSAAATPASATVQLGVFTPGAPASAGALAEYAALVGRQPDIVMWFRGFGQPLMETRETTSLRATGQTPMVTWEPNKQSLSQIASGEYDAYLHESAAVAKSWGGPLLVRFAHEMNGNWYPWGAGAIPAYTYLAAWYHIVSLFRGDGATNVSWVWSPYVEVGTRFPLAAYYPGDDWVDYIGLDGYNWGRVRGRWQDLDTVFSASYSTVTSFSSRPVILSETASTESGGDKAEWIRVGFMSTIPERFPRVTAVVWFNKNQETDWRIDSSQASLDAYRAVVDCWIYGGAGPCPGVPGRRGRKRNLVCSLRVSRRVTRVRLAGSVSFCLSAPARVRIVVAPRGHIGPRAAIVRRGRSGHNRVPLLQILRHRGFRAGRYRLVVAASDGRGLSHRRVARFRIV
jgi:hypothetical protein